MNNIVTNLFSFQGRLRRRDFWVCVLILCVVSWVLNWIVAMMFGPSIVVSGQNTTMNLNALSGMMGGLWIVSLILLWPSLALGVKRCHDRGKSGWWCLLLLIPIINIFWWLIDLGILDGTPGPNQFGPSPKGLGEAAAATVS